MSDLANAVIAAQALYTASDGKITESVLAVMVAVAGQQSGWVSVVQAGGNIGDPLVGVGIWQETPGTEADMTPLGSAEGAWALMQRDPANPYEPWNLQADGHTLIWQFGKLPGGGEVQIHPPTDYQYEIGAQAAAAVFVGLQQGDEMFIEAAKTETVAGVAIKSGDLFEKVVENGSSWLHGVPANLTSTVPSGQIIKDNADGGWINRYAGKITAAA